MEIQTYKETVTTCTVWAKTSPASSHFQICHLRDSQLSLGRTATAQKIAGLVYRTIITLSIIIVVLALCDCYVCYV